MSEVGKLSISGVRMRVAFVAHICTAYFVKQSSANVNIGVAGDDAEIAWCYRRSEPMGVSRPCSRSASTRKLGRRLGFLGAKRDVLRADEAAVSCVAKV